MKKKYRNKSCYDCGALMPINELVAKKITEPSGASFGVTSKGTKSGRAYYRNKKIHICRDCNSTRWQVFFLRWTLLAVATFGFFAWLGS